MIHTLKDLARMLAARVESVCRHLLPSGKMLAGNWCIGDVHGAAGDSLRIQVSGGKAGLWSDFASGSESGDLLDLWSSCRGVELAKAIPEVKEWLGLRDPINAVPKKQFKRLKPPIGVKKVVEQSKVMRYLTMNRKITPEVLANYRVAETATEIAFPSFSPARELLNLKYIGLDRTLDGKKLIRQEPGCAPALFGWQTLPEDTRQWSMVILTEGQIDAMTWHQWSGMPALSMPNGVGDTQNWIDYEWENLASFDKIYLSFDMDQPGREAALKVAQRLGIERCCIVQLPHKDANECLQKGVDGAQAANFLLSAKIIVPAEIKTPNEFRDAVVNLFYPPVEQAGRNELTIPLFGKQVGFRRGELSLWTGHSSHGKSSLLNQVMIEACRLGERVAIGSFEMKGEVNLMKMVCCMSLKSCPPKPEIETLLGWLSGRMWIYNVLGEIGKEKLMELMTYSVKRHDVSHFVIDSLMKCDVDVDDYNGQKKFLNFVHTFAINNNVHVHIVAHPRKDKDENSAPGMMDVNGGASVVGQPDNVISVWRNKKKEETSQEASGDTATNQSKPDTIVYIRKQRFNGNEFKIKLRYAKAWNRFTAEKEGREPRFEDYGMLAPADILPDPPDDSDGQQQADFL